MSRRLRTDRMRRHIPGWTERSRAEFEALLHEAFAGSKHVLLPPGHFETATTRPRRIGRLVRYITSRKGATEQ